MSYYNTLLKSIKYYTIFNVTYYLSSFFMFAIDYSKYFINHKIQKNKDIMSTYKKVYPTILFNTFIGIIPCITLATFTVNIMDFPFSYTKCMFDIVMTIVMSDVIFYTSHRLFHHHRLYKIYHKKHHEIIAPVGLSALYMTLTDFYFGNILPVFIPMIILSSHDITFTIWLIMVTSTTVILSHCGFEYLAEFHDAHHSHFNYNYGTNIFMDRMMNTYLSIDNTKKNENENI